MSGQSYRLSPRDEQVSQGRVTVSLLGTSRPLRAELPEDIPRDEQVSQGRVTLGRVAGFPGWYSSLVY